MGANPFKIPGRRDALIPFVQEIIQECYVSLEPRRQRSAYFRSFYYTGSEDGKGTKHNKCFSHIDKLSSLLFSPSDIKFDVTFDGDEVGEFAGMGDAAARYLTKEYYRSKSGLIFGQGVDVALVEGCSFVKKIQGHHGPKSAIIKPRFMGVLREDLNDLDEQDAFVHSFYVTPRQLRRLIANKPDDIRAQLLRETAAVAQAPTQSDFDDSYFHEIVMGGLQPITTTGTPGPGKGTVSPYATPSPMLSPEVAADLVRVDDVWIMDDEKEDWTTIRYVAPGIILEGDMQHRNLSGIPHEQPFTKICPNEVPGYFWGAPELATVTGLQQLITARMNDVDNIIKRQSRPSRVFTGFGTISAERAAALMSLDGIMTDDSPTGKVETLAPTMPPNIMEFIAYIDQCFDDQAGITATMSGNQEQGVRSANHANTLTRNSTPRLRDRAMLVEDQCAADADLHLKMLQAKDAKVHKGANNEEFLLSQLPDDATVMVDSHSSSPAFSGDQMQIAFNLKRFGAISNEDLLDMIPGLPNAQELKLRAKQREAEQAKFIQEHPELLAKGKGGAKK